MSKLGLVPTRSQAESMIRLGKVTVNGKTISKIGRGLLVLLGVENGDSAEDAAWLPTLGYLASVYAGDPEADEPR